MKIGIIGGGITGLSTALALQKLGLSAVVYEQAPQLNEIGAGLWLQPNAIQVLDWLGLKDEVQNQGNVLDVMQITNSALVPYKAIQKEQVQDKFGNTSVAIHRAKLQNILYKSLQQEGQVCLGKKYLSHKQANNGKIRIEFQDGAVEVDVLLGADGIHSLVRKTMFPQASLRDTKQLCWRGVSNISLPASLQKLGKEVWGKQIRFGFSQISKGKVYWFAVVNEKQYQSHKSKETKTYLKEVFQKFSPTVNQIISNTSENDIHQGVLKDLKRLDKWSKDSVCLLGDAAHATTPNMGQGACQGIEDAFYISQLLLKNNLNTKKAFEVFEKARRKKVDYVVNNSWQFGKMTHSLWGQSLMKMLMKLMPNQVIKKQMQALYTLDEQI